MKSRALIHILACMLICLPSFNAHAASNITASAPAVLEDHHTDGPDQLFPQVAYGNGHFLVVWQQGRDFFQGPTADIYGELLDESGNPVKGPFRICSSASSEEKPQVVFNNDTFLIVWQDFRNGRDWDIYATRISSDGELPETDGFIVAGGNGNQALPAAAAADRGFLVVWQDFSDGAFYKIYASLVGDGGQAGRANPVVYTGPDRPGLWGYYPGWGYKREPLRVHQPQDLTLTGGNIALTKTGTGWIIAWNDNSNWSTGGEGIITGRFARLKRQGDRLVATEIERSPSIHLGKDTGRFATSDRGLSMYAGWSIAGKGERNRVGTAVLFGATGVTPLANPNTETKRNWSAWNTETMIPLFFAPIAVEAPIAITFGHNMFFAAASSPYTDSKTPVQKIYAMGIDRQGRRIYGENNWPVLHESSRMLANPALSSGGKGFLLVYQQENNQGNNRIWSIFFKVNQE